MTDSEPRTGVEPRSTLSRWLKENAADTRLPDGPDGRLYPTVPFARAWDAVMGEVGRNRTWSLVHSDEELGILTIACRTPVLSFTDDLTVWVSLDANGFTRVEARSASRVGRGDMGVNRRRLIRLMKRVDRAVGAADH
jgi:hypothetical protein